MIRDLLLHPENRKKIAVIEDAQRFSFEDLLAKAAVIQKRLPDQQQSNIAIFLPNGSDYIIALFGVFMAGMIAVPFNTQLTVREVAPLLAQTHARAVVTSVKYRSFFNEMADHFENIPQIIYAEELPEPEKGLFPAMVSRSEDEPMIMLNTSGTTGAAKIVQLSERNVWTSVYGFSSYNHYEKFTGCEIKYILGTPFASVYGLLIVSTCLLKAFPMVIPKEAVTVDVLYKMAEKQKITHYEGGAAIPIAMDQMLGRKISYDLSSLKFIGYGGSKVPADALSRLAKAFPQLDICQGYGSTETAAMITRPDNELPSDKLTSVGIAIPEVTVMVEVDDDVTDAPHVTGEILVKGSNVMLGYYQNEEETRKIIQKGYLHTGDMGYLDEDGYLYLCGRKKNVIMVRGFSVYAEEVEDCLLGSGLVQDCIVYGETEASGAEILWVDLVPKTAQVQVDEIRAYCRDHLADYKRPQKIRMVESIQKTATGKMERKSR